jgi:hypothetical protein
MTKLELLLSLRFGARVAEDEVDRLEQYFVETDEWKRLFTDEVDIVYGAKGSGKSALYALVNKRSDELFDRRILLVPAENPRGATVFTDLVADPPPNEHAFITLWKLYFVVLIAQKIREYDLGSAERYQLINMLEEAALLPPSANLSSLSRAVRLYLRRYFNRDVETLEHGISYDPASNTPTLTRKATYRPAPADQRPRSVPRGRTIKNGGRHIIKLPLQLMDRHRST